MRLVAELKVLNVIRWNAKWIEGNLRHTKLFSKTDSNKNREYIGEYYYDFGDGWLAKIEIREAEPREKITDNFGGYEEMLTSIIKHKKIISL